MEFKLKADGRRKFAPSTIQYTHSENGVTIRWDGAGARVWRNADKKILRDEKYKEPCWDDPRVVKLYAERLLTDEERDLIHTEGIKLVKRRAHLEWATEMFNRLKSEFLPE